MADASTNTKLLEPTADELVPLSLVEGLLEQTSLKVEKQYEETTQRRAR